MVTLKNIEAMKKILFMSLAAIAMVLCMASCGSKPTPTSITKDCIESIKNGDYKAFAETLNVGDEEKAQFQQLLEEKGKKAIEKKDGIVGYEILSEEISEDGLKATVEAEIEYGNGKKDKSKFRYELVDGEWKQVIKK